MIMRSIRRNRDAIIIAVGDQTTKTLLDNGVLPSLIIIDNKVNRVAYDELKPMLFKLNIPIMRIISGPGYISDQASDCIRQWAKRKSPFQIIEIDGEEDLLTLPVVAHAPIGSIVYYGQPHKGIVEVVVTTEKKKEVQKLLSKFLSS